MGFALSYAVPNYNGLPTPLPLQPLGYGKPLLFYYNLPNFGTLKIINFPFGTNGKLIIFKCRNISADIGTLVHILTLNLCM